MESSYNGAFLLRVLMKVLALDPALRNTGFAVAEYNGEKFDYIKVGVIQTRTKTHTPINLIRDARTIYTDLTPLLAEVDCVVSECSTFSQNADNATTNGIVVGVLAYVSSQKPLYVVSQAQAKAVVKQGASKQDVSEWANKILPYELLDGISNSRFNHIADALAVLHSIEQQLKERLSK